MKKKHAYPESCVCWPDIDVEIGDWKKYLTGRCLNAGAGHRDLSHLVDGELVNQDLACELHNDEELFWLCGSPLVLSGKAINL